MFSKLSVIVTSVLVTLAAATPARRNTTPPVTTPTSPQCCNSVVPSSSSAASIVAALLGLDVSSLNVPIGLSCSPITVVGNNWYAFLSHRILLLFMDTQCSGSTTVVCDAPQQEWSEYFEDLSYLLKAQSIFNRRTHRDQLHPDHCLSRRGMGSRNQQDDRFL
ncbi:hypothetical protein B0H10DRAFT_554269 [Mycena sp. CBHHK59/15]|nr:hypothetical protein B0H10DRAFT_554269 [Mycena sp. CBHHK59/15]